MLCKRAKRPFRRTVLEWVHNELITSHNKLKDEYTTLKINHDTLVIAQEFLPNEPHDATNHVVKIE